MNEARLWVIVPAAGTGSRFGSDRPKQYAKLLDGTVLEHTLKCLLDYVDASAILVAISEQDADWANLKVSGDPRIQTVAGGEERADSVENALHALSGRAAENDWVLVHDAARPCLEQKDVAHLLAEIENHDAGGLLAVPVADTLKRAGAQGEVEATIDRSQLWQAQTPQVFRYGLLARALKEARECGARVTDESSAIERAGFAPKLVSGSRTNIKITHGEDLLLARLICGAGAGQTEAT